MATDIGNEIDRQDGKANDQTHVMFVCNHKIRSWKYSAWHKFGEILSMAASNVT